MKAGLGITLIDQYGVTEGMQILGPENNLPDLGHAEIAVFNSGGKPSDIEAAIASSIVESFSDEPDNLPLTR